MDIKEKNFCKNINLLRLRILELIYKTKASHIGSIYSCLDIIFFLYAKIIKLKKKKSNHDFILSKGHSGLALYVTLAHLNIINGKKLDSYYSNGSKFSGHVSHYDIPGIDFSTGSLGHGLSIGCGLAYGNMLKKNKKMTYVLMSDGECDEGSVWEAALFASHNKLKNLVCIIDYNKLQSLTTVKNTLNLEPFSDKWKSFGWIVREIDGHNFKSLKKVFLKKNFSKPLCIIAHTTKGKGVSFMENSVLWHYRSPNDFEFNLAKKELQKIINN